MPVDKNISLDDIVINKNNNNEQKKGEKIVINDPGQKTLENIEKFWTVATYVIPIILIIVIIIVKIKHYMAIFEIKNEIIEIKELLKDSPLLNEDNKKDD